MPARVAKLVGRAFGAPFWVGGREVVGNDRPTIRKTDAGFL